VIRADCVHINNNQSAEGDEGSAPVGLRSADIPYQTSDLHTSLIQQRINPGCFPQTAAQTRGNDRYFHPRGIQCIPAARIFHPQNRDQKLWELSSNTVPEP